MKNGKNRRHPPRLMSIARVSAALLCCALLLSLTACSKKKGGDVITVNDVVIKFDTQGGTPIADVKAPPKQSITLPNASFPPGYLFDGWYAAPTGGALIGPAGAPYIVEGNATLYARWKSVLHMDPGDVMMNGIVCVFVDTGTFTMGSPPSDNLRSTNEPQRTVKLTKSFYISKYPVTNRQYDGGAGPANIGIEDLPVVGVTWEEAAAFAASKSHGTWIGTLPTEAQWEYAARGGHLNAAFLPAPPYLYYSGSNNPNEVAWYNDGTAASDGAQIVRLNLAPMVKEPNVLGIYDMSGNVWEWVSDWYSDLSDVDPAVTYTDPQGSVTSTFGRVLRGGGWDSEAKECRAAERGYGEPGARYGDLGFRMIFTAAE